MVRSSNDGNHITAHKAEVYLLRLPNFRFLGTRHFWAVIGWICDLSHLLW